MLESVKLVISDENISNTPAFFAGPIQRLASATDVVLVGPNRMLFTHLAGQTLHVLERADESADFQIVNSIITTARGRPTVNDLMSWHEPSGLVAVSNCRVPSATMYRVTGSTVELAFEVEMGHPDPGFCHGVGFSPDGLTVCLVNSGGTCAVRFNDVATGVELHSFVLDGWRPKDAAYVDDHRVVVPFCDGSPTAKEGHQYGSRLALITVDASAQTHQVLDSFDIPGAHVDGVWVDGTTVYVADQTNSVVKVLELRGDTLVFERDITGVELPHGISTWGNQLAITSYDDSSLNIMDIATDHFEPARTYVPTKSVFAAQRYSSLVGSFAAAAERETALLDALRETVDARTERIGKLENDRQALRDTLEAERLDRHHRLAQVNERLESRTERIKVLEAERAALSARVDDLRSSGADRTERIDKLNADRAVLTSRLDDARRLLAKRTERIERLEHERELLRDRVATKPG